jgi:hypothetical protein
MGGSNNGGWSKRRETWGSDSIIDFKRNDDSLTLIRPPVVNREKKSTTKR